MARRRRSVAPADPDHHWIEDTSDRDTSFWSSITVIAAVFVFVALAWSAYATVDELSRADGRVIPSSKTQIIQSAESGVVRDILVREGQRVQRGQVLMRIDDTGTSSSLGEVEAKIRALTAQIARLRTEYEGEHGSPFECPPEIAETAASICANESSLLQSRYRALEESRSVLISRVEQRERELAEAHANIERLEGNLEFAQNQLALIEPLAGRNLVAQTELIQAKRDVADLGGQLSSATEAVGRIEAQLREARIQLDQADTQFRQEALAQMTESIAELTVAQETFRGAADRVYRTEIRSPVDGIVSKLEITTVGAFVNAGTKVMDVVPVGDTLLVEANLRPADIAFVRPGQLATVKFTAYDFTIYGGLEGIVDTVSADSYLNPDTGETFYTVLVRTETAYLERGDERLPILPGMVSQVEILTGRKTVLDYLLKPINRARQEALTER